MLGQPVEGAFAARGALAQRPEQRQRLDAGLYTEGEDFGKRGLNREARAVMGQG
jgi:hypothetical protein